MSLYQIGTAPAVLFPDGELDSQVIYNRGPSSVYLSDQSAVSPSYGVRLQPTGSTVWDAGRPLYAVCQQGSAALDVQQGSNRVSAPQVSTYRRLYAVRPTADTGTPLVVPVTECASYKTLFILWDIASGVTGAFLPRVGEVTTLTITWYDDEGNSLGYQDVWTANNMSNAAGVAAQWRIPVQGAMFSLTASITTTDAAFVPGAFVIAGSSNEHDPGNFPGNFGAPTTTAGAAAGSTSGTIWDTTLISPTTLATRIWLPSYGPILTLSVRTTGAITAAGDLTVYDTLEGSVMGYGDKLDIPVAGASTRYTKTVYVPVRRAISIFYNAPTGVGSNISLTCQFTQS